MILENDSDHDLVVKNPSDSQRELPPSSEQAVGTAFDIGYWDATFHRDIPAKTDEVRRG